MGAVSTKQFQKNVKEWIQMPLFEESLDQESAREEQRYRNIAKSIIQEMKGDWDSQYQVIQLAHKENQRRWRLFLLNNTIKFSK